MKKLSVIHLIPESPNNHISTSLKYARKAGIKTQIKVVLHHICTYDHLLLLAIRIMHTLFGLNLQRQWKNSRNTEDESPGSTWLNFLVKWIKLYFHYFQRVKNSVTAILLYCITFILCCPCPELIHKWINRRVEKDGFFTHEIGLQRSRFKGTQILP